MSKSDEMFEELGYCNKNQVSADCIEYEKPDKKVHSKEYFIVLDLTNKTVVKVRYDWENDEEYLSEITLQELQAIYQFCKERGWLDE